MITINQNHNLLSHNTFKINAFSDYFVEYETVAELQEFLQTNLAKTARLLPIGQGSNLLFLADFKGIILHSKIKFIEKTFEDESFVFLRAGAGILWDNFVEFCVENQYFSAENLSLIPGEVGAAAVQNIGAYGVEVKDIIVEVETVDMQTNTKRIFKNFDCHYAYRESIFKTQLKDTQIVTAVIFRLLKEPIYNLEYAHLQSEVAKRGEINLQNVRQTIIEIRSSKLPDYRQIGNAGSFFKNPYICIAHYESLKNVFPEMPHYPVNEEIVKIPAAWLIERCGWKEKNTGKAAVYEKQPLVLVNLGGATGAEIAHLATEIQKSVEEKFSIKIETEVNFI